MFLPPMRIRMLNTACDEHIYDNPSMNTRDFDTVFQAYYPALCLFAQRLVADQHAAEELVDDVFLHLWESPMRTDAIQDLRKYLYTATRNRCLNFLDKMGRERRHMQSAREQLPILSDEDGMDLEIFRTEVLRQIYNAIEQLPEQCRKVMQLSYHEGLPSKEIASRLGVSVSTVDNQRARGLMLLKQRLSGPAFLVLFSLLS